MDDKSKKAKGRPPRHGAYSLMIRAGELPKRMTHIRRYLTGVREGLIRDVTGREVDLTTAQAVLIARAISLLGVIRTVEEALAKTGILKGGVLAPILQENYLAYTNSLRLILRELGIDKRKTNEVLDLADYIQVKDAEKANEAPDTGDKERPGPGENRE